MDHRKKSWRTLTLSEWVNSHATQLWNHYGLGHILYWGFSRHQWKNVEMFNALHMTIFAIHALSQGIDTTCHSKTQSAVNSDIHDIVLQILFYVSENTPEGSKAHYLFAENWKTASCNTWRWQYGSLGRHSVNSTMFWSMQVWTFESAYTYMSKIKARCVGSDVNTMYTLPARKWPGPGAHELFGKHTIQNTVSHQP